MCIYGIFCHKKFLQSRNLHGDKHASSNRSTTAALHSGEGMGHTANTHILAYHPFDFESHFNTI